MAGLGIKYNVKYTDSIKKWGTAWTKSLDYLGETGAMTSLARGYRYYMNKFVPKDTGALRRSARCLGNKRSAWVSWVPTTATEAYMHYQFVGDVYGPNKAHFNESGIHDGWRSPVAPGEKWNTHRKMGIPFTYELRDGRVVHVKGYTTKNTGYDWINRFKDDDGENGEKAVTIRAGRYIYELFCWKSKQSGRPVNPVGGYQVYYSWRQIENIRT